MKTNTEILTAEIEKTEDRLGVLEFELTFWQNKAAVKESRAVDSLVSVTRSIKDLQGWLDYIKGKLIEEKAKTETV